MYIYIYLYIYISGSTVTLRELGLSHIALGEVHYMISIDIQLDRVIFIDRSILKCIYMYTYLD